MCDIHPKLVKAYIACNISHGKAFMESLESGWTQKLKSWYMLYFQCPAIPDYMLRLGDLHLFIDLHKDFTNQEQVKEEDIEAYKFTYQDRGEYFMSNFVASNDHPFFFSNCT